MHMAAVAESWMLPCTGGTLPLPLSYQMTCSSIDNLILLWGFFLGLFVGLGFALSLSFPLLLIFLSFSLKY